MYGGFSVTRDFYIDASENIAQELQKTRGSKLLPCGGFRSRERDLQVVLLQVVSSCHVEFASNIFVYKCRTRYDDTTMMSLFYIYFSNSYFIITFMVKWTRELTAVLLDSVAKMGGLDDAKATEVFAHMCIGPFADSVVKPLVNLEKQPLKLAIVRAKLAKMRRGGRRKPRKQQASPDDEEGAAYSEHSDGEEDGGQSVSTYKRGDGSAEKFDAEWHVAVPVGKTLAPAEKLQVGELQ